MASETAAVWSAIAASCSAIAAFTILRIQHKHMIHSARPELVLTSWKREHKKYGSTEIEVITFSKIKNVGKGSAFHVYINAGEIGHNRPTSSMSTLRISILPVDEEQDINGEILLFWDNVVPDQSGKYISIKITIYSWCSKGYRHETIYNLMAEETKKHFFVGGDVITPGVMLSQRRTISKPVWRLKLFSYLSRLPFIGKFLPKKN